ncbi:tetratricopeptide repeat protein, partial [Candidatus Fermentibacteria bacterium]|nr:tetratricopeptide repeat protein [Candidatus Fermentibacteria bacterium]
MTTALVISALISSIPGGWYTLASSGDWNAAFDLALGAVEADSSRADAWAAAAIAGSRSGGAASWTVLEWADRAVSLDSSSAMSWTARGVAISLDDPPAAGEAFRRALGRDSVLVAAWDGLGEMFLELGSYDLAIENFQGALSLDSAYVPSLLGLARAWEGSGGLDSALALVESAARDLAGNPFVLLELGRLRDAAGLDSLAIEAYEQAVAVDSTSMEAMRALGLLYESLGRTGHAIKQYRAMIEADSSYAWAYGELAFCYETAGSTDTARVWYQRGLEVSPGYAWAALRLGLMAMDEGDYELAADWLDTAASLDPTMTDAWVHRGLVEEDLGNPEAAAGYFRKALETDPLDTWTWGELGYVLDLSGDPDGAGEAYETAVGLDSSYAWGWEQRGLLFEDQGRTDDAIEWYLRAAETGQPSAWLLGELGMLLEDRGLADSAASMYSRSIAVDSTYAFGTLRLARILEDRERIPEALPLLEKYMSLTGDSTTMLAEMSLLHRRMGLHADADSLMAAALAAAPDAMVDLAWSYFYSGREETAIETAMAAAEPDSLPVETLLSIAEVLKASGGTEEAGEIYERAARTAPDDSEVWIGWGLMYSDSGDYGRARELFEEAVRADSTSVDALNYLGESLLFQDMYEEAREVLERALEIEPSSVFAICYLGLIEERRGEPSAALDRYLEALRLEPGYEYAESRIRAVTDPDYDVRWWREDSRRFDASVWVDLSIESGNTEERSFSGGAEASWTYGPRRSEVNAEFSGSLKELGERDLENSALASVSADYFITDVIYAKTSSSWDRQPETVRPWQVSSYASIGYREWITDWLWVSPEVGAGLVRTQWYLEQKRTDRWTSFLSLGAWLEKEGSLLPSLWIGSNLYMPPEETEDVYAWGNAELTFEAWDRLSLSFGCTLDFTNRPVVETWEKL